MMSDANLPFFADEKIVVVLANTFSKTPALFSSVMWGKTTLHIYDFLCKLCACLARKLSPLSKHLFGSLFRDRVFEALHKLFFEVVPGCIKILMVIIPVYARAVL